jgi:hypothetical protein
MTTMTFRRLLSRELRLVAVVLVPLLIGCAGRSPTRSADDEPVRYAKSVNVAVYDTTQRATVATLAVFQGGQEPARPYHVIALLSRDGWPNDEGLVMNAIAWRAPGILGRMG